MNDIIVSVVFDKPQMTISGYQTTKFAKFESLVIS
jgi:hypothetical protein